MRDVQNLASAVVGQVLSGTSLDAVLGPLWARHTPALSAQQRGAIQDLSYGTLRWFARLDAMLDVLLAKPIDDARLRHLLLVALYQLEHTRAAPYAIVDHAVRVCSDLGLSRAKGLVNGVLRNFLRRPAAIRAAADRTGPGRHAYPAWWIAKAQAQYPGAWSALLERGNQRPPLTLRVNARRSSRDAYLDRLAAAEIPAQPVGACGVTLTRAMPVDAIPGFADGLVSVQDAGAQLAVARLQLAPAMRVLDACAAPGGKTAHMLEHENVAVTALDVDAVRLRRVADNLNRLGLSADIVCGDAANPGGWWDGVPFDRILADVPCSASGIVRRHPDIKWLRRPADIERLARTQASILDALWRLLGSGGKLLYATCSVFHEENHLQVARFLERHDDARHESTPAAEQEQPYPAGQIFPDERHDGFYYAVLRKA